MEDGQGTEMWKRGRKERRQGTPHPHSLAPHTSSLSISSLSQIHFFLKETEFAAKSNTPSYALESKGYSIREQTFQSSKLSRITSNRDFVINFEQYGLRSRMGSKISIS